VFILGFYGGMTEILQGFTQTRTPRWADWFQDLGGIAAGEASYWTVAMLFGMCTGARRRQALLTPPASDDWEALQKLVPNPTSGEES